MVEKRQSINEVTIVGIVSENGLEKSTYSKNGAQVNCIRGDIKIRVRQALEKGGNEVELEIPVSFFASEVTNSGTVNVAYTSLLDFMSKVKSIAQVGEEGASWVRIAGKTGGRLEMNEYYKNDVLVSFPRVSGSFVNIITPNADTKMEAKFSVSMYVGTCKDEVDSENIETGRYIVNGVLVKWDGSADVMSFIVTNPQAIEYMKSNWETGSTVNASGKLNFSTTTKVEEIETAFGEPEYRTKTMRVSELIITSGSPALEGDFAFPDDVIEEAAKKRTDRLAALKAKGTGNDKPKAGFAEKAKKDFGF